MTVTVTVPATMSSDGSIHTYTDDSDPNTGLDGGGHVPRLLPLILDNVSIADYALSQVSTMGGNVNLAQNWATQLTTTVDGINYSAKQYTLNAETQANNAAISAAQAVISAAQAAQQANTLTATSVTSMLIGTGSKTFTTQSGEQFIAGQFVTIANSVTPSNFMYGQVTDYSTTQLTVNVSAIGGSGTLASWLISLSGLQGVQGIQGAPANPQSRIYFNLGA